MAKMMGPRFKQCRRLGLNVCGHPKAMDRAVKGTSRADKKLSPYGLQLLEKHSSFDDKNSNFDFHIWNYLETPFHTHKDYYELFLVTKGPIKYYVNGKMVLLKSKDMSMLNMVNSGERE